MVDIKQCPHESHDPGFPSRKLHCSGMNDITQCNCQGFKSCGWLGSASHHADLDIKL